MEQDNIKSASGNLDSGFSRTSYIIGGIIILIISFVGMKFLSVSEMPLEGTMMAETVALTPGTPEEVAASERATADATTALMTQGTSDELVSIDADLKATDLDSLGDPSQL